MTEEMITYSFLNLLDKGYINKRPSLPRKVKSSILL